MFVGGVDIVAIDNLSDTRRSRSSCPQDPRSERIAAAVQLVINPVHLRPCEPEAADSIARLPTEWLALSYCRQSAKDLAGALGAARSAALASPRNGYAWARVAELEFSFGRRGPAEEALQKALALSPRNAQAHALNGFLLAGAQKNADAMGAFESAISLDPGLGNAWLGRGLCRIRNGAAVEGRNDLLVAAALEPQRAQLRSYLGKALADAGETVLPNKELGIALTLDTKHQLLRAKRRASALPVSCRRCGRPRPRRCSRKCRSLCAGARSAISRSTPPSKATPRSPST